MQVYFPSERVPALLSIAQANGAGGAIPAFIVPLDKSKDQVQLKEAGLEPGRYGIVVPEKNAALNLSVGPLSWKDGAADEARRSAGREPEAVRLHVERIIAGQCTLADITIAEIGPDPLRIADMTQMAAERISALAGGMIRDIGVRRWRAPGNWPALPGPAAHVTLFAITGEGKHETWVHTLGMYRFRKTEMEVFVRDARLAPLAGEYLMTVGDYVFQNQDVKEGEVVGQKNARLMAVAGKRREANWGEIQVLELAALSPDGIPLPYADEVFAKMV